MARRVELLDAGGHLAAPVPVAGVVHGHPEDLPRRGQRRAVNRFAGPTGAVDRGGPGRVGEDRHDAAAGRS